MGHQTIKPFSTAQVMEPLLNSDTGLVFISRVY